LKDVTIEEQIDCKYLISKYSDKGSSDIGTTDKVKHRIDLHDHLSKNTNEFLLP
jgi:hypothetical protein